MFTRANFSSLPPRRVCRPVFRHVGRGVGARGVDTVRVILF